MNTKLTAHQFDLNDNLHTYVDQKLTASLSSLIDDPAAHLEVTLSLQNHNQADEEGICVAHLTLPRLPPIVVQKSAGTVYAAIDAVHDTLLDQASNALERRRDRHHRRQESATHREEIARQVLTTHDGPIALEDATAAGSSST